MPTENSIKDIKSLIPEDCVRCRNLFFAFGEYDFFSLILKPRLGDHIESIRKIGKRKFYKVEKELKIAAKMNKL